MRGNRAIILAQSGTVLGNTGSVTWDKVMAAVYNVLQTVLFLAGMAVVVAFVVYGIMMATAGENVDRYKKSRTGLIYSGVGALIIFGVYTILATVRGAAGSIGH